MAKQQGKPAEAGKKKIRVTLVGGLRGTLHNHRESVKGLGLKRIRHTVEVEDTPSIRGMINQVSYLVKVEE
jgi:large subunit ribosomal protein L30